MKKFLLSTVFAVVASTASFAADLPVAYKAPVAAPALVYNWTGFYVGAGVGYAWSHVDSFTAFGNQQLTNKPEGAFFALHGGYDFQLPNNVVIGFELAAPVASGIKGTVVDPNSPFPVSYTGKLNYVVTGTAHVGYALGNWLPYVGGGIAVGEAKATVNDFLPGTGPTVGQSWSNTQSHTGYTVLAGLRYGFAKNWWTSVQYNYTDLGSQTYTIGAQSRNIGLRSDTVKLMVSYKF